ncbi:hypothetical protein ACDY97_16160 [Rhizobium mongolense]|uniref:hypothetical protein n=1 Tax=Rhizobium mongolense TaxID=57676 RepID=UPI003556A453
MGATGFIYAPMLISFLFDHEIDAKNFDNFIDRLLDFPAVSICPIFLRPIGPTVYLESQSADMFVILTLPSPLCHFDDAFFWRSKLQNRLAEAKTSAGYAL